MQFSEQIKNIRKNEGLTQEQMAAKLNVTRQAISNWENNKNLPDIEMLIQISNIFNISLDQLIKNSDNQVIEKVIKDGSETRKAKYNMIILLIGSLMIVLGIILILIKAVSVEYIDDMGVLHENFFLLPIAFLCIFCGLIAFLSVGIKSIIRRRK